ncbi:MAG: DUF86 domain-containing protein [Moorea sp. SIO4G2]|uniref:DUF86 domain-containing protein n=1 Tax=Moorena bouillonii PNG TaxID=568701 RepID=A0A1U7MVD5_9CYAN|nr:MULTISPECIES: DUF86 domain-containing protein [Moorena]NEO62041.1 DUF86 domain-containing protein [Moorena sp. SIO4G2]NEQ85098.1 DUF86 domain-containing protein [Moorena sp. SIO2I5]NEO17722.1 DUF86 domain-containing protein [Moorena sp. SIO3E8]NEO25066.1 DUF86 domain-containing protein [Moorena sp. SIO4A5]NEP29599.1 DUF86 domain-containing protein [Moorena sp. SIO3I6]
MTAIDDLTRLHHMQDAAIEALGFMSGKTREDLAKDRMLVLAVVKDLEIIGEAAGRISAECRGRHADIPWAVMIGMRNRLTHAYFSIDLDIVWGTVRNDLVPLVEQLQRVIQEESEGES